MVINQAYLFLIFILDGLFIGLVFDFFRILRKSFKTINFVTYLEDILFWIITGISIIFCMYKFAEGTLRLFMFLGLGLGLALYMLTFSKIIIKTFVFIITTIKKIIYKIVEIILIPIKCIYHLTNIMFRPIYIFYIKTQMNLTKKFKKIYYNLNNVKKI